MLELGRQGSYEWLVTDKPVDILQVCPEVVLGKYVAITSIDSGPLKRTDETVGWRTQDEIAYSPKVLSLHDLPRAGWDEWYIFQNPIDLGRSHIHESIFEVPQERGHVSVFVNYNLSLHRPEMKVLATLLWEQIARIGPESYIAENEYLNFVSANKAVFAIVRDALKAPE